uniref:Uncharacterized protein n=1 Tax=Laticauda laticaudata TaxID=8630 RepID=A0A8C5SAS7_LATLA
MRPPRNLARVFFFLGGGGNVGPGVCVWRGSLITPSGLPTQDRTGTQDIKGGSQGVLRDPTPYHPVGKGEPWALILPPPTPLPEGRRGKGERQSGVGEERRPCGEAHLQGVLVNGGAELEQCLLVELAAVDDAHLLEEGRLAALAGAQQQDPHQAAHGAALAGQ